MSLCLNKHCFNNTGSHRDSKMDNHLQKSNKFQFYETNKKSVQSSPKSVKAVQSKWNQKDYGQKDLWNK